MSKKDTIVNFENYKIIITEDKTNALGKRWVMSAVTRKANGKLFQ